MPKAVILGASVNPDRYSHQAVLRFAARGYAVVPVHPSGLAVGGHPTARTLADVPGPVDVVSVYVNPAIGLTEVPAIARLQPRLVLLNPGADGSEVRTALEGAGLRVVEACSLVLLAQGDPLVLAKG